MNVCFVLNVVNVCWGSFYDVFYGIDVLGDLFVGKGYDVDCGGCVIVWVKDYFDIVVLLVDGLWVDVVEIVVVDGVLMFVLVDLM